MRASAEPSNPHLRWPCPRKQRGATVGPTWVCVVTGFRPETSVWIQLQLAVGSLGSPAPQHRKPKPDPMLHQGAIELTRVKVDMPSSMNSGHLTLPIIVKPTTFAHKQNWRAVSVGNRQVMVTSEDSLRSAPLCVQNRRAAMSCPEYDLCSVGREVKAS